MENISKYIRLIIYTNSLLALSYSLTFKISIDLLIQSRFTGGGGPFTMSFPVIVFLISRIVNAVHSIQLKENYVLVTFSRKKKEV
jgi:hypothetical protein